LKAEWKLFLDILHERNGHVMLSKLNEIRIESVIKSPVLKNPFVFGDHNPDALVFSDSSSWKAAVIYNDNFQNKSSFEFKFQEHEKGFLSGLRELLAMKRFLTHKIFTEEKIGTHLFWGTDSENVVVFTEKGSSKPWIQTEVFEILKICHDINVEMKVYHLLRSDPRIKEADELSKNKNNDNWSIDAKHFTLLNEKYRFEWDLFADAANARTKNFVSLYYEPDCKAVDAFTIDWNLGILYLCPPVGIVSKVVDKICKSKCQGVLIFPDWPASSFYCKIFSKDRVCHPPFNLIWNFRPYITQNECATKTPLFGFTSFEFLAVHFNTL